VNTITNKLKQYYADPVIRSAFFILLFVIFLFIAFKVSTKEAEIKAEDKKKLDSLETVLIDLKTKQKSYDSIIYNQNMIIEKLDYKLDHVKQKETIIKEYYRNLGEKVDNFNNTQVDSFFRNRYGY